MTRMRIHFINKTLASRIHYFINKTVTQRIESGVTTVSKLVSKSMKYFLRLPGTHGRKSLLAIFGVFFGSQTTSVSRSGLM